jgi:hypothetical protein
VRLFRNCVWVSRDGGHVQGFIKVFYPRVSYWSKGKGIVEKGFDNMRHEGRPSSVNLRRFEPPWGESIKRRWILGGWSHQMNFKNISLKVEEGHPLGGVVRQAR